MAHFYMDTFDFSRASRQVTIPENNVAKLMYYLNVICDLIEYDEDGLDRLRNFNNYRNLSADEIRLLYVACVALSPDLLIDKIMFEDSNCCGGSTNRIYQVSEVRHDLVVVNSIYLAGRNRRVKKIMVYRPQWLTTYYIRPLATLTVVFEQERRREAVNDLLNTCTIS